MATEEELVVHARLRDDLSRGLRRTEAQLRRTAAGVRGLGGIARRTGIDFAGLDRRLSSVSQSLGRGLVRGATMGGAAIGALTAGIGYFGLKTASSFQTTNIAFEAMLGSAEKGQKMFADLQKLNVETPFELSDVAGATQLMLRYGVAADDVLQVTRSLGDAAALTMAPAENLNRLALAVGQVVSANRLTGQEARQLAEAGINAYGFFAEKLGVTTAEARKLGEAGELSAEMLIQGIMEGDKALGIVAGSAERLNKTLFGQFSNLKDQIAIRLNDAAGPFVESFTAAMPAIIEAVGVTVDALAPPIFDLIALLADLLRQGLPVVAPLIQRIVEGLGELLSVAGPALSGLEPVIDEMIRATDDLVAELVPVMPELVDAFIALVGILPNLVRLLADLVSMAAPFVGVLADILALAPVEGVLTGILVALLAYRGIAAAIGMVQAMTTALYGLAGASTAAATAGAGAGAAGVAGAATRGAPGILAAGRGAGAMRFGMGAMVGLPATAAALGGHGGWGGALTAIGGNALAGSAFGPLGALAGGGGTALAIGAGALLRRFGPGRDEPAVRNSGRVVQRESSTNVGTINIYEAHDAEQVAAQVNRELTRRDREAVERYVSGSRG